MRSLRTPGSMTENRFSSEDKVEKAIMDEQEMKYLYDDGEYYYFIEYGNLRADAPDEGSVGRCGRIT